MQVPWAERLTLQRQVGLRISMLVQLLVDTSTSKELPFSKQLVEQREFCIKQLYSKRYRIASFFIVAFTVVASACQTCFIKEPELLLLALQPSFDNFEPSFVII